MSAVDINVNQWLSFCRLYQIYECILVHCKENPIYVFLFWELRGLSHNFHIHVSVSDLYIPRIGPHTVFSCSRRGRQHKKSVLEITVSFLGIHKWEPDIYIGFSPALHLQCTTVIRLSSFSSRMYALSCTQKLNVIQYNKYKKPK